jgi:hypothetical protein
MDVLSYSGVGTQKTANEWDAVLLPMSFNAQDSTDDQAFLENKFGIVLDPSGKCAVINVSNRPVHMMLTMMARVAGNNHWNNPVALGVFNTPVTTQDYDPKSMVAASTMNYQHRTGNVVVMTSILPVLLAGQSFHFAIGGYHNNDMTINDLTLRFSM